MGPNVRCVVYSSTPCSIRSSLQLRKNIEQMIQNNSGNKKRTTARPPLLTDCLCGLPYCWAVKQCRWDNAFIWRSSEHINRSVYISVLFDVSPWVPIQSANGQGTLHRPASCFPPPPFPAAPHSLWQRLYQMLQWFSHQCYTHCLLAGLWHYIWPQLFMLTFDDASQREEKGQKTDSRRGSQPEANEDFCVCEAHIFPFHGNRLCLIKRLLCANVSSSEIHV